MKNFIQKAKDHKKLFIHFLITMLLVIFGLILVASDGSWRAIAIAAVYATIFSTYFYFYKKEIKKAADLFLDEEIH